MDKLVFMKRWYDAEMNDENNDTTPQEMAYILYAAAVFAFTGEKINIGDVFGKEFKGLNRSMPNIYSQIVSMKDWEDTHTQANQKYDNEKIKELAIQGFTQKEICEKLGYDVEKSKSLSSNKGYREGRQILQKKQKEGNIGNNSDSCESSVENCQKTSEKIATSFNF